MSWWKLPVAEEVRPAVAHLADQIAPRQQHQHRGRGAHSPLVLLRRACARRWHRWPRGWRVRTRSPASSSLRPRSEPISLRGDPHRHLARDLAGRMAAHAVGHDEDPVVGEHQVVVFVARTDDPDVGASGAGEVHETPLAQQQVGENRHQDQQSAPPATWTGPWVGRGDADRAGALRRDASPAGRDARSARPE